MERVGGEEMTVVFLRQGGESLGIVANLYSKSALRLGQWSTVTSLCREEEEQGQRQCQAASQEIEQQPVQNTETTKHQD